MKAMLLGGLLTTTVIGAAAQVVSGSLEASHDSDSFNEQKQTVSYRSAPGWGIRAGALRYSAPGWSERGTTLAGTFKQDTAERQIEASLGVARLAQHDHVTAALNYMQQWWPGTSLGVSAERELINSQRGIEAGMNYTSVAGVVDHAFTPRFNVGAVAGATFFPNDNQRPLLRTRWNYLIDDRYGLNVYLKTRSYRNTRPYQPEYFSPSHLNEASVGVSSRFAVAEAVTVTARMDAGQQRIDGDSQAIWSAALGLASRRGSKVDWMVGVEATNAASLFTVRAESYRYTSAVARVSIPF